MGTPSTVPMFAPDGTLGDIPFNRMMDAKKAGFTVGVTMKSADGQSGIIPANRVQDAVKGGLSIVPHEEQEMQHPGGWQSLYEDALGLVKGSAKMAAGLGIGPGADNTPQIDASAIRAMTPEQRKAYIEGGGPSESEQRKAAGYGPLYRGAAPVGEKLGINVKGEEQSAAEGDFNGVLGHAAALPVAIAAGAGISETASLLSKAAETTGETANAIVGHPVIKFAGQVADIPTLGTVGRVAKLWNAYNEMRAGLAARKGTYPGAHLPEGDLTQYPGASLPEVPPPQILQANALGTGPTGAAIAPEQAAALAKVGTAVPAPTPASIEPIPSGEGLPRSMSGESVLNQVLAGRDNATLLKIARSRGINVTKEAQLKAGAANKLLINKIVDDFSDDELQEVRDQNIENRRFRHAFGDLPEEAWNTMALQTYFPDIKISEAALKRTQTATAKPAPTAPSGEGDLVGIMQESVKQAKTRQLRDLSGQ